MLAKYLNPIIPITACEKITRSEALSMYIGLDQPVEILLMAEMFLYLYD